MYAYTCTQTSTPFSPVTWVITARVAFQPKYGFLHFPRPTHLLQNITMPLLSQPNSFKISSIIQSWCPENVFFFLSLLPSPLIWDPLTATLCTRLWCLLSLFYLLYPLIFHGVDSLEISTFFKEFEELICPAERVALWACLGTSLLCQPAPSLWGEEVHMCVDLWTEGHRREFVCMHIHVQTSSWPWGLPELLSTLCIKAGSFPLT